MKKQKEIYRGEDYIVLEGERKMLTIIKIYQRCTDPFENEYWKPVFESSGRDAEAVLGAIKDAAP